MTRREETPSALGYHWPAEWEPHASTWVAWPHNRETWPGKFETIPHQFTLLVRTIAEFERVNVLAGGPRALEEAGSFLGHVPNVTLWDIETNDAWCRDHGPTFLAGPAAAPTALVDWQYNAWGGKYPPFDKDNAVPERIASHLGCRRFAADMVLEGGSIEGNGRGTLLTTDTCLLDPNRNPHRDRSEIEECLHRYLGVRNILWLHGAKLAGDDTDGHIDQLARFVGPSTVVAANSEDRSDENYAPLQETLRQLRAMSDEEGRPLEIVPLALPEPKFCRAERIPASYANFYIANDLVIVPQFDDPADSIALDTLGRLFPRRQVRGLPALDIAWGLGAFHCLTQQQPAIERGRASFLRLTNEREQ